MRGITLLKCSLNIVSAVVAASYLGLPHAMVELGWRPGIAILVMSWVMNLYMQWQVMEMPWIQPQKLGQYLDNYCPKLKCWVLLLKLMAHLGVNIVDMVSGGVSLNKFHDMICLSCNNNDIKSSYYILIFASVVLLYVLASYHFAYFNSLMPLHLASATILISFSYWPIVLFGSLYMGVKADVDYSYKGSTIFDTVLSFFSGLGELAFVFADPGVVLEILARVPSSPPEKPIMGRVVVVVAHVMVALCLFPVALLGYYVFGNAVDDNILITLHKPAWLIATANLFVVIQVIQTYQIYSMQVLDLIKAVSEKGMSSVLAVFILTAYVLVTMVAAIVVPYFGDLLGFFGGFASALVKYILPCVMWLAIKNPKKFSFSSIANWICIIFGVTVMILASIGSLYKSIK